MPVANSNLRAIGLGAAFSSSVALVSVQAAAYSTSTVVSDPCHEKITQEALSRVRDTLGDVDSIRPNDNERALIDDVPFELRDSLHDLGAATLVIGNRNVDFRGNEQDDLNQLAPLHGKPGHQDEHCLRMPEQDGPEGSKEALADCRQLIRRRISAALDGMTENGVVDPDVREEVKIALDIRGSVDADLPTYPMEMGRALHTVQDGFSHTYRTDDNLRVVTVLNYAEMVEGTYDRDEDGPTHRSPLDACKDLDALREERLEVATRASEEFLLATLEPAASRAEKMDRVDALLEEYFTHVDGCDVSNDWCDAPEERYKNSTAGCSVATPGGGSWLGIGLGLCAFLLGRSRRRQGKNGPKRRHTPRGVAAGLAAGVLTLAVPAKAQYPEEGSLLYPSEGQGATPAASLGSEPVEDERTNWGVALNLSAALQNPAVAGALGVRYRLGDHWLLGVDGEYNPWYARTASKMRRGVVSGYGTVVLRFPMRFERVNLRSTLQLGASRMMFDLYGVPEGTVGPYLGVNFLGIDYELARQFYLVVNPAHIAVPIPQTTGAPFSYPQYRITLGLQLGA